MMCQLQHLTPQTNSYCTNGTVGPLKYNQTQWCARILLMLYLTLYISHNFISKNGTILSLLFQFTSWMCQFLSPYDMLVKMIESEIWCNFGKYGVRVLDTVVWNNGSKLIWTLTNYWAEECSLFCPQSAVESFNIQCWQCQSQMLSWYYIYLTAYG